MPRLSGRLRRVLAVLAGLCVCWAGLVWLTGGGVWTLGGVRVSSRSAMRPGLVGLLLGGLVWWATSPAGRRLAVGRLDQGANRVAPLAAALLALVVAAASATFGEHVAGGADSSGYLHQSRLWTAGRLTLDAPVVGDAPWPDAGWRVAPLGFVPSPTPGQLGPAYSPGLPGFMAVGAAAAGEPGRFVWTPLAAGLLVWLTFVMARDAAPAAVALAGAVLVGSSPPVLFAATQTMSDLLCASLWTAAVVGLGGATRTRMAAGAVAAALALVVRPNLVLVAGGVWAASLAAAGDTWPLRRRRGLMTAAPLALAALAIAAWNTRLWGAPLSSGYSNLGPLFAAANVDDNLARLWQWTRETRGYWLVPGVAALPWLAVAGDRRRWWPALALMILVVLSYLPYAVFAEWWYFRFYLPAWPALAAGAAIGAWHLAARVSPQAAAPAVLAVALVLGGESVRLTAAHHVFDLWRDAQRYPAVAEWVEAHAPVNAVVWSVQHSGALAYGSTRTVARWDHLPGDALDADVARLWATGRPAWVVLEDWEEADWRRHFAGQARGRLDWAPLAEARVGTQRVRIYDLSTPTRGVAPALIRVVHGGPWPWARRPTAATPK